MEFREIVRKRRMVHSFDRKPVPRDLLLRVLEVARHAPSAGFSQGFDFVVLDEPQQVEWFWRVTEHPNFPYPAALLEASPPCIVLPIANVATYLERYSSPDKAAFGKQTAEAWPMPYWFIDTGMAVMLQLLAAVEDGLGGWFFGLNWGEKELLSELGVPEECRPIGALGLGYPLPDQPKVGSAYSLRRRPLESMIHLGQW